MRIAVISDIHANLEALQSVLDRIGELDINETVCLGDIVGYNANPNECVEIVRDRNIVCVLGNHDACASGLEQPEQFTPLARAALFWTRERLTAENRQFLLDLPREKKMHDSYLFHGSIHDTNQYLLSRSDASHNFGLLHEQTGVPTTGFFGHTHVRAAWIEDQGIISGEPLRELTLAPEKRYLINPGSVGQPRDGEPHASFLVYDRAERTVTFCSVEYDIRACQDKIVRAGLPQQLAERLSWGR
jgi:predicted phosphodiesterase